MYRWLILSCLYLAQGLPFGFFTQSLPAMMRMQGASLQDIGLASGLALPWGLKFLWAPLVDRYGSTRFGRRRSFIVPLQILSILLLMVLAFQKPEGNLVPLMAGVLLINFFAATQDIATDGLAISLLSPEERGLGNGIQVAGYRLGMILGGGILLMLIGQLGWTGTFMAMAAITLACTLPVLFFKEPPSENVETTLWSKDWFWRPDIGRWLLLLAIYKSGDALGSAMVKPMLVDYAFSLEDVGFVSGTIGSVMGLTGALIGGWIAGRYGRQNALIACGTLQAVSVLYYGIVALWSSYDRLLGAVALEHLTGGMATVALFTTMMDRCRPEREATDYTVQASLVVAATGTASVLSGFTASALGYPGHFVLAFMVCLIGLALVPWGLKHA